jgi:hypothetical protein
LERIIMFEPSKKPGEPGYMPAGPIIQINIADLPISIEEYDEYRLDEMTKAELVELAEEVGADPSGNKQDIINAILLV